MISIVLSVLAAALTAAQASSHPQGDPAAETKAKVDVLLQESHAAEKAGDLRLMFAKLDEVATLSKHPEVMHKLGHMYEAKTDIPESEAKAMHWYAEAASLGHGEAQSHVAKALENDGKLSDKDYSKLVDALEEGTRDFPFGPGRSALDRLGKKHAASGQCAVDLAKRLGYVADDVEDLLVRQRPSEWYIVRRGSGTASSGDRLNILAAEPGAMFGGYSRLSVRATGFTGIKYNKIPLSTGGTMTLKEYTGFRENASSQGRRDAETILAACRPRS